MTMRPTSTFALAILAGLFWAAVPSKAQTNASSNHFESNIRVYEAADKANAPPKGAIVFAGDSQFFRWKTLAEDLPGYTIVNRGVDSFQTSDLVYFADRIVTAYQPRLVVINVGGNDVHAGKSPEQVLADLKTFVAKVRAKLPDVPIVFACTTPCPERWSEVDKRKQANETVKAYVSTQRGLKFVDMWGAMLTAEGKPRQEIWGPDGIHSNHDGYLIRAKFLRPVLGEPDRKLP
jgi:lysophospholipase L1-like esterase